MSDIYVDAAYLACPQPGPQASEVIQYVEDLSYLHSLMRKKCVKIFISSVLLEVLEQANFLPPWGASELDRYVQKEDVTKLFFGLTNKLNQLEVYANIYDVLLESPVCKPNNHLANRHRVLIDEYNRMKAIIALGVEVGSIAELGIMLTKGITDPIDVNAKGNIIEVDFVEQNLSCQLPHKYDLRLCNVGNFLDVVKIINPISLWSNGHLLEAIGLAVYQRNFDQFDDCWPLCPITFRLHPNFYSTAKKLGFFENSKKVQVLIRACVETVINEQMEDTHALRVNLGGNAPQKVRSKDGAQAWRRDIDYEYHLHYWQVSDVIEFASVVVHSDYSIPE